jgi:aryl-alcohol dehydrogenase-like predicted oxidoreductase
MRCWNVTEDIDLLYRNVMERDLTKDDIANALLGIKTLYEMKFEETFDCFTKLVHEGKIT